MTALQLLRMSQNKNLHKLIKSAIQARPIHEAFLADLIYCIEAHEKENNRIPSHSYKPSSMNCIRNMYFQLIGQKSEKVPNYSLIGMSETGIARHDKIQSYLILMKEYGIDCEYVDVELFVTENNLTNIEIVERKGHEVKLYHKGLNMRFLCDGIIKYKGEYFIFEYKTESTHKEMVRKEVAEEHHVQATAYSVCLGINKVLFVYENRDNCHKKSFVLDITDDMKYDLIISKIEECDEYVKNAIIPPKPKDVSKKSCQYCDYRGACRKAG